MNEYQTFLDLLAEGQEAIRNISRIEYVYHPRELIAEHDKIKLYHYKPRHQKLHRVPLLVVFATVNRPEILDLFPDSFIAGLLNDGIDVYLLDWGYPDIADRQIGMTDYLHYLDQCVNDILKRTKQPKIDLLGICQGGVICLCYAILYQTIQRLVLISTPIDFHTRDNTISNILQKMTMSEIIDEVRNVSGTWLTQFFISMRPFELLGKKYLQFLKHLSDPEKTERFLRVEKWLNDTPDQPAQAFREFVRDFYQANKLIKGEIYLSDQVVDLHHLTIPVLNVMADEDEIIPMSASKPLKKFIPSQNYDEKIFNSGHIGIYVSDKVRTKMPSEIAHWLNNKN